jgi:hypothetical protein
VTRNDKHTSLLYFIVSDHILLGWQWLKITNTLAYYIAVLVLAVAKNDKQTSLLFRSICDHIRLGCRWLEMTNTQANCIAPLVTIKD